MATQKLWKVYRYWIEIDGFEWSYIGCTSQSLNDRAGGITGKEYIKKSPKFGFAIETYGWGNFQREILEDGLTEEDAFEREQFYIQKFDSVNHGFNTSTGGKGGTTGIHHSEESQKKTSEFHKGKTHSEESRKKMSESHKGKTHSKESRKKISESLKGHSVSAEARKKISESHGVFGVLQYDKSGNLLAKYPSILEASRQTGTAQSGIVACCKGRLKSAGGSRWAYATY